MAIEILGVCFKFAVFFAVMVGAVEVVEFIDRKEKENE